MSFAYHIHHSKTRALLLPRVLLYVVVFLFEGLFFLQVSFVSFLISQPMETVHGNVQYEVNKNTAPCSIKLSFSV